ncbi:monosaccharide-binding protein [Sanguibacter keddieii DSM 10542]|jgi:ribose transport system substrate-binding protein|uniref:Monosaccharide-binding protein n=1 Tax=Sanguibacter keddieii (strain ATCC 51767 / DSM 10542 / NCFB 3025 / ST-74) TaxID=446469 RepID=D1BIN8_SANKS|nr:substrate-binding domain-containing protein [Sanguibacter keddieii]ACZ20080.1 monosaccharide-binding protein [Sanguibacter keddieii DSM 10542]
MTFTTRGRLAAAVLTTSLVLAGTAACGRGDTDGAGSGEGSGESVTLSLSTLNNPFFVDVRDGAQEAADELGIDLTVVDAQNDSTAQTDQIASAVSSGTSGLLINAVDSDAAAAAVAPALSGDLPVIGVDRAVNGAEITSLVSSDNVAGGSQAADALAAAIGEEGKVIVLQGQPGTSASRDRGAGFTEGIAAYPGIEVVAMQTANFDRAQALDVATNLLQANPDVVGIFAENDEMALGAIQALGARAGDDVHVVGFDGTDDGLAAVEAGTLEATIAQQPRELGRQSVQLMADVLAGETVDSEVPVAVETVTVDNVGDYQS